MSFYDRASRFPSRDHSATDYKPTLRQTKKWPGILSVRRQDHFNLELLLQNVQICGKTKLTGTKAKTGGNRARDLCVIHGLEKPGSYFLRM